MRLALALEYPLMQQGGTEVLVRELLRGFSGRHEIVLVSGDKLLADLPKGLVGGVTAHVHWDLDSSDTARAQSLAETLRKHGVQLAHFHFGGNFAWNSRFPRRCPIPLAARLGVKSVTTIHAVKDLLHGYCGEQRSPWFKLAVQPAAWFSKLYLLRHVAREIAVSEHDLQLLRRWYWPMQNRFSRIYHSRIQGTPANAPGPRQPVILCVGHLARRKGQMVLAEAFLTLAQRFQDWTLVFAGYPAQPDCARQIEAAAAKCPRPNQIQLLGPRDDVAELMQKAEIFVQPSFYEGLPLSLQESLFYGCACLATAIPGNTELVEDQVNGLLVPPGDPRSMSVALERLVSDQALRRRLASNAHGSVIQKQMTADQMIEKHERLYAEILAAPK